MSSELDLDAYLRRIGLLTRPEADLAGLRVVHLAQHTPFPGFNRAQAAVIEAAILARRLHMLPLRRR